MESVKLRLLEMGVGDAGFMGIWCMIWNLLTATHRHTFCMALSRSSPLMLRQDGDGRGRGGGDARVPWLSCRSCLFLCRCDDP